MKYRSFILLLLVTVALGVTVGLVSRVRDYQRAVYRGRHVSEWAAELYPNFDPQGTNEAIQAFRVLGSNAVPDLRAQLKSGEPFYEKPFVRNARRIPVVIHRYLFEAIQPGQSFARRVGALRALSVIGVDAVAAAPDLIVALNDPASEIRGAAGQTLGRIGAAGIAALMRTATNENVHLRQTAVAALGEAGTNAAGAATVLLDRLLDKNEPVRISARYALGRIGPAGEHAVLESFLNHDPVLRVAAFQAFQAMNHPPPQAMKTLIEFTTNASPAVRQQAIEALSGLRLKHPQVAAAYLRVLGDLDPAVRCAAAHALSQVAIGATNAALNEFTGRTLGLGGSLGSVVLVKLNELLTDPEPSVRTAAQRALTEIKNATPN